MGYVTQKDIEELDADTLFERMKDDVGPGWQEIIAKCHQALRESSPKYKPVQIKEKFGTLRYYVRGVDFGSPEYAAITEAEKASETTCEECGKPGTTQSVLGWYRCLCPEHFKTNVEKQEQRRAELRGEA